MRKYKRKLTETLSSGEFQKIWSSVVSSHLVNLAQITNHFAEDLGRNLTAKEFFPLLGRLSDSLEYEFSNLVQVIQDKQEDFPTNIPPNLNTYLSIHQPKKMSQLHFEYKSQETYCKKFSATIPNPNNTLIYDEDSRSNSMIRRMHRLNYLANQAHFKSTILFSKIVLGKSPVNQEEIEAIKQTLSDVEHLCERVVRIWDLWKTDDSFGQDLEDFNKRVRWKEV